MTLYTRKVLPPSLHYVFINAWNEWGEGCCLEPDTHYGLRYLEAVRDVMGKACLRRVNLVWGEGNPLGWRARWFPSPQAPHPSPNALLSGE